MAFNAVFVGEKVPSSTKVLIGNVAYFLIQSLVWGRLWAWVVHISVEKIGACVNLWQRFELTELVNQVCNGYAFISTQRLISPIRVFRSPGKVEHSLILNKKMNVTYSFPEPIIYAK